MTAFAERVGLEHFCTITTADGATFNWDANQPPGSRLRNLTFSTKIGEGFSLATGTLARRIDQDYPDLRLGAEIVITGADGAVVFEGRLSAMPRELGQTHAISVTFVGHMAHAKDRKFSQIYVDRALSSWAGLSIKRRANLLTGGYGPVEDGTSGTDPSNSQAGLMTQIQGAWATGLLPASEAWYDAGPGNTIGQVTYSWQRLTPATISPADVNWSWAVLLSTDDVASIIQSSGNLRAAGPTSNASLTRTGDTGYRWAVFQLVYNSSPAGSDGNTFSILWSKPAVYGTHGLTLRTGDPSEPQGIYVSDILRDIAGRYCPEFDTSGVEDFNYVVQHCAWREREWPYEAFKELNKYALQHLAVWEHKTLTFRPYDLTDYQWEIRTDDPGTTFAPVGPTLEDTYNGIVVTYTDLLTGIVNVITPDDEPDLRDTSDENPHNQAGRDVWYEDLVLSSPALEADAVQIARAVLAEKNRPKTAGTLTVQGYIRDRAGNPQPVSRVRAGDVICVTNFNEINRLIVETDYDDETKTLRVAVDFPFQLLEALFDRQANARQAKGL